MLFSSKQVDKRLDIFFFFFTKWLLELNRMKLVVLFEMVITMRKNWGGRIFLFIFFVNVINWRSLKFHQIINFNFIIVRYVKNVNVKNVSVSMLIFYCSDSRSFFFFFYKIDPKLLLQHNFTKFNFQLLCLSIKLAWSFVLLCHDEAVQFIIKYLNNIGFNKILIINYLKQILDGQYCGTISVMLFLLKIEEKNDVNGVQ